MFDAAWQDVDCTRAQAATREVRPALEDVSESVAQRRVASYIQFAACQKRLPESSFEPFFFEAEDVGHRYRFEEYRAGFAKQPTSLRVETDTRLHLLFCFNQQAINCNEADRCECPYDFNHTPRRRASGHDGR